MFFFFPESMIGEVPYPIHLIGVVKSLDLCWLFSRFYMKPFDVSMAQFDTVF